MFGPADSTATASRLDGVALFAPLGPDGRRALEERGRAARYSHGETLMREGDASDVMHIILEGEVSVEVQVDQASPPLEVAILGPGQVVGEMGLLTGERRSATVTAREPTVTLELDGPALAAAMEADAVFGSALQSLVSDRSRSTADLVGHLSGTAPRVGVRPAQPVGDLRLSRAATDAPAGRGFCDACAGEVDRLHTGPRCEWCEASAVGCVARGEQQDLSGSLHMWLCNRCLEKIEPD